MHDHEMNIFWKKIVDTINDGLMFIGPEGSILMVNKAFERLTGYTSKQAIGMSCDMLGCDACEQIMQTDKESLWCKLFEKARLIQALKQTKGNQSKAATLLNINRVTVWNRMKKYGIDLKKVLSV